MPRKKETISSLQYITAEVSGWAACWLSSAAWHSGNAMGISWGPWTKPLRGSPAQLQMLARGPRRSMEIYGDMGMRWNDMGMSQRHVKSCLLIPLGISLGPICHDLGRRSNDVRMIFSWFPNGFPSISSFFNEHHSVNFQRIFQWFFPLIYLLMLLIVHLFIFDLQFIYIYLSI